MRITDALRGEHAVFYMLFADAVSGRAERVDPDPAPVAAALHRAILGHAHAEDDLLFRALDPHFPGAGPLACMREEHEGIEQAFVRAAESGPAAQSALVAAIELARDHFLKEEQVLFPLAESALGANELLELGATWAELRGVFLPRAHTAA